MYLNYGRCRLIKVIMGLTLTWDVFKLAFSATIGITVAGLTLTWDVFKLKV